jgi:diguanylate cyclase (GGDEF)-like protein
LTSKIDQKETADGKTSLHGVSFEEQGGNDACLVIIRGARLGSRVVLGDDPLVIGRSVHADFQIAEQSISRRHCRVFRDDGRWWVEDLGSTNHSWINDRQIDKAPLHDGDHLRISQVVLKFIGEGNIEAGYHSELHEHSIRDTLTGLYNRRHAMAVLETEAAKARRDPEHALALVIFDLDFFKDINDEHGHLAGDEVLRTISQIAQKRVRGSDTLARIGGEEFALILPGTPVEEAWQLADDIRASVADTSFEIGGKTHRITLSGGVAGWRHDMAHSRQLLQAADHQLYEAKSGGRNRVA